MAVISPFSKHYSPLPKQSVYHPQKYLVNELINVVNTWGTNLRAGVRILFYILQTNGAFLHRLGS